MAGGPVFDEAGLAAIGVTCTNPNITAGNDYYFRICFLDNFQAQVLVNFAKDKFSAQKAYCLGELGNEYDQGLIAFFEQNFDGEVIKDSFPTNTSDFTTYLNKAVAEDVDVIFCNNDGMALGAAAAITAAGRTVGEDIYLLGVDALEECQEMVKNGTMTGTVLNDHVGQSHKAVDVAVQALNGEAIDNYYWVDYVKVDASYFG